MVDRIALPGNHLWFPSDFTHTMETTDPGTISATGTGAVGEFVTTPEFVKTGTRSYKVTTQAGTAGSCQLAHSISAEVKSCGLWIYVPDYTKINSFTLYVLGGGNDQLQFNINSGSNHDRKYNGWHFISLNDATSTNGGAGCDWTAITHIYVTAIPPAGQQAEFYVDSINVGCKQRPTCLIFCDDGYETDYDVVAPYLDGYGLKGNFSIVKGNMESGNGSGWLSVTQAQEMYANGHDMVLHGTGDFQTDPEATTRATVTEIQNYLTENGMSRGIHHMVYPGGKTNQDNKDLLGTLGVTSGRGTITLSVSTVAGYTHPLGNSNLGMQIPIVGMVQSDSVATIQGRIDSRVTGAETFALMFHEVVTPTVKSTDVAVADFQAIIDHIMGYVNKGLLEVYTVTEWQNRFRAAYRPPVDSRIA